MLRLQCQVHILELANSSFESLSFVCVYLHHDNSAIKMEDVLRAIEESEEEEGIRTAFRNFNTKVYSAN